MLTYRQALEFVLQQVCPLPPVTLPLAEAGGKVLAGTPKARWDLPATDNSAMDGFAFAFAGQREDSLLPVTGFLPAGAPTLPAPPSGQAVRIMTGVPLPAGCDTVVPFEEVRQVAEGIRLARPPRAGQHVRRRGEELRRGHPLFAPGQVLHSGEIGLLAAAGIAEVRVVPTPRVALLATGDELVGLGAAPEPGQIVNSNLYMLDARLCEEGYPVERLGIAKDRLDDLREKLQRGLEADLLITTGGVSVGDRDLVQQALRELDCTVHFWRVAIKPGKPVLFASRRGRPVFSLPGNPAAAAATFEILVRPALRGLAGHPQPEAPRLPAMIESPVAGDDRQRFIWGTATCRQGRFYFAPAFHQQSGRNSCMDGFNALLPVAAGGPGLAAGEQADILLLRVPKTEGSDGSP